MWSWPRRRDAWCGGRLGYAAGCGALQALLERSWGRVHVVPGRRFAIESHSIGGRPAVRLVGRSVAWSGWRILPSVIRRPR